MKRLAVILLLSSCFLSTLSVGKELDGKLSFTNHKYKSTLKELQPVAENGDAEAQYGVGLIYVRGGNGVDQDFFLAGKWFELAARQGHLGAIQVLKEARQSCIKADNFDESEAHQCEIDTATGNPTAELNVAYFYHRGKFLPKDLGEAARWFRRAGVQREPTAHIMLARIYDKGEGVAIDEAESYAWLCVAEKDKLSESQGKIFSHFLSTVPILKIALAKKMDNDTLQKAKALAAEYTEKYSSQ